MKVEQFCGVNNVYLSGKIDFVFKVGCMGLEIKGIKEKASKKRLRDETSSFSSFSSSALPLHSSNPIDEDNAVMSQALNRVYVLRSFYAQLSKAIIFAVGPNRAWILIYSRSFSNSEKLACFRIGFDDISPLWSAITHQMIVNKKWFLSNDADILNEAIMHLGFHPALTRSEFVKTSVSCNHRVYIVTVPRLFKYMNVSNENAGAHSVLGCSAGDDESVAIKIFNVLDLESFENEADNVMAVKEKYNTDEKVERFYVVGTGEVLGYESSGGIQIEWTTNEMIETHSSNLIRKLRSDYRGEDITPSNSIYLLKDDVVWDCFNLRRSPLPGGFILMRNGKSIPRKERSSCRSAVCDGVLDTLHAAHSAGIYHCDIRWSNILQFGTTYQLIDFDHSVTSDDSTVTLREGAQLDGRGRRLRKFFSEGDEVVWTEKDDLEMLLTMLTQEP